MKFKFNINPFVRALLIGCLALSATACHDDHEDALIIPEGPVVPANTAPTVTSTAVLTGTVDDMYSYTLTATDAENDTLDWTLVSTIPWLMFDTSTGVLSGIPDAAGSYDAEVMVSDGTDAVSQTFTIVVSEAVDLGPELLINGDFENSSTAWTLPGDDADTVVTEDDNTFFQVDVTAVGEPHTVNLSQVLTLVPDTTYQLSFRAKGSVARTMLAGLGLNADPWTNVTENVELTTEWQTFIYTITTTGFGDDNSRVLFDMGAAVGMVSIDDVTLMAEVSTPAPAPELLMSGGFDGDAAAAWVLPGGDTGTIVTEDGNTFFQVDVTAVGEPHTVNLSQVITLIPATSYVLSFRAKGSAAAAAKGSAPPAQTITVGLGLNYAPWTNVVVDGGVPLTTEWADYSYTIATDGFGDENNRVLFDMGAEAGVVSLDDVSVTSPTSTGGETGSSMSGGDLTIDITNGINFEGTESEQASWEAFENGDPSAALEFVANPSMIANTTNSVAKLTPLAADADQGKFAGAVTRTVQSFALSASNAIVKIWVYKDKVSPVGVKFEKQNGDGFGSHGELTATNTLINEWEQLTIDFTTQIGLPENDAITGIAIFPDMVDGRPDDTVVYFDEITFSENGSVGEVGAELLTNGNFEDTSAAWTNADGLVVTEGDNSFFQVDVTAVDAPHTVNLSQGMTLIPDTAYVVNFKAKASVARTMLAGLGLFHDPWTNITESVALTTEWQEFTYTITTTGFGDDDSRVLFDMGAELGMVSIDDVSVVVTSGGDTGGGDTGGGNTGPLSPVDFEAGGSGAAYTWAVFEADTPALEIVTNPNPSGINTSATVAKFTALQTNANYAGTETDQADFGPLTIDATNSTIKIMVYKTVISDVGLKFAIASGGAQNEIKVANTQINQWEELTFDFSGYIGLAEAINIDQLIIFPDFNARSADTVSYFDNITFGSN
jgi:hypothetical protein